MINLKKNTKIWLLSFLKLFLLKGKKIKIKKLLNFIIFSLIKEYKSLNNFFMKFYEILYFPFYFKIRVIAGRKVVIPFILKKEKEIFFLIKYLKQILINRSERFLKDKLLNELKDIYMDNGSSLTKKKIQQLYLDLRSNFVNLRFIRILKK